MTISQNNHFNPLFKFIPFPFMIFKMSSEILGNIPPESFCQTGEKLTRLKMHAIKHTADVRQATNFLVKILTS